MNRAKIEDVLLKMGVPAGVKGFNYIVDSVEIIEEKGEDIRIIGLYQAVADRNDSTSSKVERAIRYAFSTTRNKKENEEAINYYIGLVDYGNASSLKRLHMLLKRETP